MYRGLFINLDRSRERRRRMEREIRRFKLSRRYERLSAVDGHPGATGYAAAMIGCFRSHLKAVERAKQIGGIVHILEDDTILSSRLKPFLTSPALDVPLRQYDLLFLDMWVDPDETSVRRYQEAMRLAGTGLCAMNLRDTRIGCADSYLVSPRSVDKVARLMAAEIGRGPRMPVDAFYGQMVGSGQLSAAVMVPFLTCIDLETGTQSSIQTISREQQRRYAMLRAVFFVDRDRQLAFPLPSLGVSETRPGR